MKELIEEYVLENRALREQIGLLVSLAGYLHSVQSVVVDSVHIEGLTAFSDTKIAVENGEVRFE